MHQGPWSREILFSTLGSARSAKIANHYRLHTYPQSPLDKPLWHVMKTSTSIPHMDCDLYYQLPGAETFRLLVLEPSPCSSDPVCARLLVTEPSAAPAYDAISYVWGDRETKFDIYCDGRPFPITANLHWALVRIRDVSNLRIVWADASKFIFEKNLPPSTYQ